MGGRAHTSLPPSPPTHDLSLHIYHSKSYSIFVTQKEAYAQYLLILIHPLN